MTRKCSSCSHNGHNARTCSARGVKLFGVRLTDGAIRKSASMGNLSHYAGLNIGGCGSSPADGLENAGRAADGYASEGFVKGSSSSCAARKKGVPWTEEEHRMFLLGLKKLGKGEWRGIARNFVVSRSPAQVASHAQKYFLRQMNTTGRKRRSSLFDMVPDEASETQQSPTDGSEEAEAQDQNQQPTLTPLPDDESESMDSSSNNLETAIPAPIPAPCTYPVVYPAYFMPVFLPAPYWPSYQLDNAGKEVQGIVRPTAVHPNTPIDVNELVGMSQLSLGESIGGPPPALSLGGPDRQSAFHANPPRKDSSTNSSSSPIHAV